MHVIDTHAHLDMLDYDKLHRNLDEVISKAKQRDVKHIIHISLTLEDYEKISEEYRQHPEIFFAVGIHPGSVSHGVNHFDAQKMAKLLKDNPRIVALGEIGLDSYHTKEFMDTQYRLFAEQLQFAKEHDLPVIIHTRGDCGQTTIDMIRESGVRHGVIHCFTEDQSIADQALELGFHIGVGGISTFKNAEALRAVLRTVPAERILVETDAPYLAPVPFRGKENQPAYTRDVVNYFAAIKGMTADEFARQTTENAIKLFNLPISYED